MLTPRAKRVVERAEYLAKTDPDGLKLSSAGTEHLLIALSDDDGGPTYAALRKAGLTPGRIRQLLGEMDEDGGDT